MTLEDNKIYNLFGIKPKQVSQFLLLGIFCLLWTSKTKAQYEWSFANYPRQLADPLAELYDGGILVSISPVPSVGPVSLIKFSPDRKQIWERDLYHIGSIFSACPCRDSGFVVAASIYTHDVDSSSNDSSVHSAIIKFDKCLNIQWAKYISNIGGNHPTNLNAVLENGQSFYLACEDIATTDDNRRKTITIVKFDQKGNQKGYRYFEGDDMRLYHNNNEDTIIIDQDLYIPLKNDTGLFYTFSGIQDLDTSLNTLSRTFIGYPKVYNVFGALAIRQNEIDALGTADIFNVQAAMFSRWDKSLAQMGNEFYYDSISNYELSINDAFLFHDSLVTYSTVLKPKFPTFIYPTLRLYDNNFKLIKDVEMNKNGEGQTFPNTILGLKNGNLIVSNENYNGNTNQFTNSSLYLYDNKLNPLNWPAVSSPKGYDWACSQSIPGYMAIDIDSVLKPVYIKPDTSKVDWQALSVQQPQNPFAAGQDNGWMVWPQPAAPGGELDFRCMAQMPGTNVYKSLKVSFYNCEGKCVATSVAIPHGNGQWAVPKLNINVPGLYLAVLANTYTGAEIGTIKVVVK